MVIRVTNTHAHHSDFARGETLDSLPVVLLPMLEQCSIFLPFLGQTTQGEGRCDTIKGETFSRNSRMMR